MTNEQIIINGIKFTENFDIICQTCKRNNPCMQECNQVYKEVIKYLFNNLQHKTAECGELEEHNSKLNKDWEVKKNENYEIACKNEKLKHKLQIATEALKRIMHTTRIDDTYKNQLAYEALKQIESEK